MDSITYWTTKYKNNSPQSYILSPNESKHFTQDELIDQINYEFELFVNYDSNKLDKIITSLDNFCANPMNIRTRLAILFKNITHVVNILPTIFNRVIKYRMCTFLDQLGGDMLRILQLSLLSTLRCVTCFRYHDVKQPRYERGFLICKECVNVCIGVKITCLRQVECNDEFINNLNYYVESNDIITLAEPLRDHYFRFIGSCESCRVSNMLYCTLNSGICSNIITNSHKLLHRYVDVDYDAVITFIMCIDAQREIMLVKDIAFYIIHLIYMKYV